MGTGIDKSVMSKLVCHQIKTLSAQIITHTLAVSRPSAQALELIRSFGQLLELITNVNAAFRLSDYCLAHESGNNGLKLR